MAYTPVNLGTTDNDNNGDAPKPAGVKINANFASIDTQLALKAPLASPALTGTPTVPTAAPGTNTNQAASTAFVLANGGGGGGGTTLRRFYDVKTQFGGFFDGNSHPLSDTYGTLGAAQAAYPLVTGLALTDQHDYAALQQAFYTAENAGGGICVNARNDIARVNKSLQLNGGLVKWQGWPWTSIRTESCGTNPGIVVHDCYDPDPNFPIENIRFYALNKGMGGFGADVPGTATPGAAPGAGGDTWRIGATAILYRNCYNTYTRGCSFHQYDIPTQFDINTWLIVHEDCVFHNNNKGICFNPAFPPSNSGENIQWRGCQAANNNYGIHIVPNPGAVAVACTIWVVGGSVDYNVCQQVVQYDDTAAASYYSLSHLKISDVYVETSGPTSGSQFRGWLLGRVSFSECTFFHNGGAEPLGWNRCEPGRTWISCNGGTFIGGDIPICYNENGGKIDFQGNGNYKTGGALIKTWATLSGTVYQTASDFTQTLTTSDVAASGTYNGYAPIPAVPADGQIWFKNTAAMLASPYLTADSPAPFDGTGWNLRTGDFPVHIKGVVGITMRVPNGKKPEMLPNTRARLVSDGPNNWYLDSPDLADADPIYITSNYTMLAANYSVVVKTTSTALTVTLPAAATCRGQKKVFKRSGATNNAILARAGTDLIDGATSYTIATDGGSVTLQSLWNSDVNAYHWTIIAKV